MAPILENGKNITPAGLVTKLKREQGNEPIAWARQLAAYRAFDLLTADEAQPYAEALAKASGKKSLDFWTEFTKRIQAP